MKTINRMVLLLATLFAAIGCSDDDKELVMYSLRFEPNSITLGIGKSYRLVPISDPFYDDVQYRMGNRSTNGWPPSTSREW